MSRVQKTGKPNVHIRLTDKHLWARIRAQAALESVPVSVVVERALTLLLREKPIFIQGPGEGTVR